MVKFSYQRDFFIGAPTRLRSPGLFCRDLDEEVLSCSAEVHCTSHPLCHKT